MDLLPLAFSAEAARAVIGAVAELRVALFARFPTPGRAKTRLIPAIGPDGAAAVHRTLAERTLATINAAGLSPEVRTTGAPVAAFRRWFGGISCVPQGGGDLGARMARAASSPPVILLGADIPDLTARHLRAAVAALEAAPVAIGPAEDGGYYLLALRETMSFLFEMMPWGTAEVLPLTLARLADRGIMPVLLEALADLDRPEDLARWPDLRS